MAFIRLFWYYIKVYYFWEVIIVLKRITSVLTAVILIVSMLSGCGNSTESGSGFKIGIMTGTVAQGEEEYRTAQMLKEKYPDIIECVTYPDNFVKEQETTIANMMQLASDPDIKVIIMCIGITGASSAFEKVKEERPDILLICGNTVEDPDMMADIVDILIHPDEVNMGYTIPQQAKEMGAETLVHYSFPRHMASPLYKERFEIMKEECERLGITFVEETCPDPMGDLGISGAQMFMLEDIPKKVAQYGKNTAFFNTNCSMQEPLIKASLDNGAIVAQQCCPSPYHGYPGALGISVDEEHAGDTDYIINAIKEKVAEKNGTGRFSTWETPVNMTIIESAVEYAIKYGNGETNGKNDPVALQEAFDKVAGEGNITMSNYKSVITGEELSNVYMILGKYVNF